MLGRVYSAILNVQRLYLKYPTIGGNHKYGERVFAYEFYHQLREKFNDLYLNVTGEPIKGAGLLPDIHQTIIPDFVIHNYATNEHNEIAIEIKVTPKLTAKEIRDDLKKLSIMINGPLHYNHAIFFAGNCDLKRKITNSTTYKHEIFQILSSTPSIIVWYSLPFKEGTDMSECISKDEILAFKIKFQ